jgi:hypothetical protein
MASRWGKRDNTTTSPDNRAIEVIGVSGNRPITVASVPVITGDNSSSSFAFASSSASSTSPSIPTTATTTQEGKGESAEKGDGPGFKRLQPDSVCSEAGEEGPSERARPKARAAKPPARFIDIDTGVSFLDRYREIDSEPMRQALRDFLQVNQDEGKALSAAAITQQLKHCRDLGAQRALAAMANSAQRRLAYVAEPFGGRDRGGATLKPPGAHPDIDARANGIDDELGWEVQS